jgi:hypothetical protein
MDDVGRIADAVLYEGYVLWPYRRSAVKNQRRWTFGGVYPKAHCSAHPDDPFEMITECLVEAGAETRVEVCVRFLHVVSRQVMSRTAEWLEPVDEVEAEGTRHVSWDEATERELTRGDLRPAALESPARIAIEIPAGTSEESLGEAGAIVRSWRSLAGELEIDARRLEDGLFRLGVRISNTTPFEGRDREQAIRQSFCSTHTVLRVEGGAFVSLTDPPDELHEAAAACRNAGTWPVLVGAEGERHTLLSSPIILPDYPQIAPESPGDLFDSGEIDQLLTLSILTLTDEERRQMREADPRAREILERTESLSEEELMRLHGAVREFGLARRAER